MMKIIVLLVAFVAFASAKPALVSAPLLAGPAVVTASSSQYYHRFNNGLAAAYVAEPLAYVASAAAPYVASPYVSSPFIAGAAPLVAF